MLPPLLRQLITARVVFGHHFVCVSLTYVIEGVLVQAMPRHPVIQLSVQVHGLHTNQHKRLL